MEPSKKLYETIPQTSSPRASLETMNNVIDYEISRPNNDSRHLLRISIANACLLVLLILLLAWHIASNTFTRRDDQDIAFLRSYGSNEQYMSLDHAYDFLWDAPAEQEAGVISVKFDENGEVKEFGAITMFHQLHCIVALRWALQKAYEGQTVAFDFREDRHWPHCLYYLRQTILCQADGQIEVARSHNGSRPSVDGAGDLRKCSDAGTLYSLFDEQKLN